MDIPNKNTKTENQHTKWIFENIVGTSKKLFIRRSENNALKRVVNHIANATDLPFQKQYHNSIFVIPFTTDELITLLINKLKSKKSAGSDDAPTDYIKRVIAYVADQFTFLLNLPFQNGCFPQKLKLSKVVPNHKKGEIYDTKNYRPITLNSSFSKIFSIQIANLYR